MHVKLNFTLLHLILHVFALIDCHYCFCTVCTNIQLFGYPAASMQNKLIHSYFALISPTPDRGTVSDNWSCSYRSTLSISESSRL